MVTDPAGAAPIVAVWRRYTEWLRLFMPMAHANLAPGATTEQLAELAAVLGRELPADAQALLRLNNGQRETTLASTGTVPDSAVPAFPDTNLLSTDCIIKEWRRWRAIAQQGDRLPDREYEDIGASLAPEAVKPLYCNRHWIPLFNADQRSDYFGLDFDPAPGGTPGQVINFGRDEETHYVVAPDLTAMVALLADTVLAAGPAEPDPPVPPAGSDDEDADEPAEDWYYWGAYDHAFNTVYDLRHPAGAPKPAPLRWDAWPPRERST